ncbi:hypothetical protein [Nostoc sp.]
MNAFPVSDWERGKRGKPLLYLHLSQKKSGDRCHALILKSKI